MADIGSVRLGHRLDISVSRSLWCFKKSLLRCTRASDENEVRLKSELRWLAKKVLASRGERCQAFWPGFDRRFSVQAPALESF